MRTIVGRRPSVSFRACGALLLSVALAGCTGAATRAGRYPHADEPIGTARQVYDGALMPDLAINTFRNIDRLFPSRTVAHGATPYPLPASPDPLTGVTLSSGEGAQRRSYDLIDYLTMNRVAGLLVIKDGAVVLEVYQFGNTPRTRWMSMSVAKSITSTLIGAAVQDGSIASLDDPVTRYLPALAGSAYEGVSVRQVLRMASGVGWNETYTDSSSDRRALLEAQIAQRPGGAMEVMRGLPRAAAPGARWNYSTGETQIAAEVLRSAVGRTLASYLSEKIWSPFGMEADATWWLESPDGTEIGGSGFAATLRDYARFGLFLLNDGVIDGKRILPEGWLESATRGFHLEDGTAVPWYGYFWWANGSEASGAEGAYSAEGIFGQVLYVNPTHRIVIAKWGAESKPLGTNPIDDYSFFDAVVRALP
jgi:CubicO group peptidase (beta-lactamase class C family)